MKSDGPLSEGVVLGVGLSTVHIVVVAFNQMSGTVCLRCNSRAGLISRVMHRWHRRCASAMPSSS
jgi:hypothetical protein